MEPNIIQDASGLIHLRQETANAYNEVKVMLQWADERIPTGLKNTTGLLEFRLNTTLETIHETVSSVLHLVQSLILWR